MNYSKDILIIYAPYFTQNRYSMNSVVFSNKLLTHLSGSISDRELYELR